MVETPLHNLLVMVYNMQRSQERWVGQFQRTDWPSQIETRLDWLEYPRLGKTSRESSTGLNWSPIHSIRWRIGDVLWQLLKPFKNR
jgi:2-polyprenyl-6-methoxyphenol hydroxylase-like FAD-dependent oxidoreductase